VANGDVPGGTGTGGNATGGDGDEAVWLDLVARFGAPAPSGAASPWPEREDLAGPVSVTPVTPAMPPSMPPSMPPPTLPEALPREPPTNPTGLPGLPIATGAPPAPGEPWPAAGAAGPRDAPLPVDTGEDHFVPPVPPPLPRLDPLTKGAWLALFGGPLYLLVSTAVGAAISALAAFLAVAAFVGGFVILVLRMDNGRPPDSGPDNGAVV
jgi:hypothetical protein